MAMAGKLSPEDEYRRLRGLGPDVPVPVSLESPTLQPDKARNLEMQRDRQGVRVRQIGPAPAPAGRASAGGPRLMSTVEAARAVLDKAALASDIATIGFAAGGITLPAATAAKVLNTATEIGLAGVNVYDGCANGNWGPLKAQAASFPARYIPGGRLLQKSLKTVRGPTGALRDGAGRFRPSRLNNKAIEKAGQTATERYIEAIADELFSR